MGLSDLLVQKNLLLYYSIGKVIYYREENRTRVHNSGKKRGNAKIYKGLKKIIDKVMSIRIAGGISERCKRHQHGKL